MGAGNVGARTNTYAYLAASSAIAGLLQTRTDGRGVSCTYGYDDYRRLVSEGHTGPLTEHKMTNTVRFDTRVLPVEFVQTFARTETPSNRVLRTYNEYGQAISESIRIPVQLSASVIRVTPDMLCAIDRILPRSVPSWRKRWLVPRVLTHSN